MEHESNAEVLSKWDKNDSHSYNQKEIVEISSRPNDYSIQSRDKQSMKKQEIFLKNKLKSIELLCSIYPPIW